MISFLLVGFLCNAATFHNKVSPVQKVVELLDDLKGKVENDLKGEAKDMDEYTKWCDEEANSKENAIHDATRTIKDLEGSMEEGAANIQSLTSEIDGIAS